MNQNENQNKNQADAAEQPRLLALFSREKDSDKLMAAICDSFGVGRIDGSVLRLENEAQVVNIEVLTNNTGEEMRKYIQKQLNGVSGFFAQVQGCDEDIRINLIHHFQQCNTFVPVLVTSKVTQEAQVQQGLEVVTAIMLKAMQQLDGIFVAGDGTKALNSDGKVILAQDGHSDLPFYFPFEYTESPSFLQQCSERQLARRDENMKMLFDRHIYVCELPLNEDEENTKFRSHEEVVRRALGTMVVSVYSEALLNPSLGMGITEARALVQDMLEDFSIQEMQEILTEEEITYIQNDTSTEQERIDFSWHYEHLYALEWLLGLVEEDFPDHICDVAQMVRNLKSFSSVAEVCEKTALRSPKEILDQADLIYRLDWAAVDARIHGMTGPAGLEHGVVQARHKTMNWMIGFEDADWDNVTTPT